MVKALVGVCLCLTAGNGEKSWLKNNKVTAQLEGEREMGQDHSDVESTV